MILSLNKTFRIKRCHILEDILNNESSQNQSESKKSQWVDWMSSLHLNSEDAWIKKRNDLVTIKYKHEHKEIVSKHREWAEKLLQMIEEIKCEKVMMIWNDTIIQEKSHIKLETLKIDLMTKTICQLVERVQIRSFKDKMLLRIEK